MSIKWKTDRRKVVDLIHWDKNPRKISSDDFEKLKQRIRERGFHDVIKVDTENVIISGNMRKEALMELGIEEVNVLVPDRELTEEEKVVVALESNRNDGEDVEEKLFDLGRDNLMEAGYEQEELSRIFDKQDLEEDDFNEEEEIQKAKESPKVKQGELYELGDHRLLIGDSTNTEDVNKLMGGGVADTIYCDPPYNIGLDYSRGIGTKGKYQGKAKADLDDSKTDEAYIAFVGSTIRNAVAFAAKNAHVFYWCDERYIWIFQTLFAESGVSNRRVCLWIKNQQNPTPQVAFNKVYEPCVYGVIGKPFLNKEYKALNEVLNQDMTTGNNMHEQIQDLMNVWLSRRDPSAEYQHPTQKPIGLHQKPLRRCTAPGHVVMDLFGGSGSTLIACEKMKRKARLIETNPIFAQVIISRWERLTGKKAMKV